MYTHLNGIHYGVAIQYTVSIMNPVEMCVHLMILKVPLLNGFQKCSRLYYDRPVVIWSHLVARILKILNWNPKDVW